MRSGSQASDILKGIPKSVGRSCGAEREWYRWAAATS